jgi:hypothetical protein
VPGSVEEVGVRGEFEGFHNACNALDAGLMPSPRAQNVPKSRARA